MAMAMAAEPSATGSLNDLAPHLLEKILVQLNLNQLFSISCVCKSLQQAALNVLKRPYFQAVSLARRPIPLSREDTSSLLGVVDCPWTRLYNPCQSQGRPVYVLNSRMGHLCLHSLLSHVPSLVVLDLRWAFNWVDDACLKMLGSCAPPTLQHLILQACDKLTHTGLQNMCTGGALQQLQSLVLRGCGDIGDGAPLSALPHLRHLDLSWCTSVTSQGVLPVCGRLSVATFRGCELLDSSVCSELRSAEVVDMSFTRVCNTGLRALAALPHLKQLQLAARTNNIYGTGLYTDSCLEEVIRSRPRLIVDLVVA